MKASSRDWFSERLNFSGASARRETGRLFGFAVGESTMNISRRYFLKSGGVAMIGLASLPSFLQRAVAATAGPNKKKMVVLFQRGAMDGLNVVVPFGEPNYYHMRPTIAIPQP